MEIWLHNPYQALELYFFLAFMFDKGNQSLVMNASSDLMLLKCILEDIDD